MTSSFGTNILGQRTDAPPDISKLDYATDDGGELVDAANKELEKRDRDLESQSNYLIREYERAYRQQDNNIQNFLNSLKSADKLIEKAKPIADYIKNEEKMTSFLRDLQNGKEDGDLEALENAERERLKLEQEGAGIAAEAQKNGDSPQVVKAAATLDGTLTFYSKQKKDAEVAMSTFYPKFRAIAEGHEFDTPWGKLSYNDAEGAQKAYLDNRIDGIFVSHMDDLGHGWGFMKKYILTPLERIKTQRTVDAGIAEAKAITTQLETDRRNDFIDAVKKDPSAVINYINIEAPYMSYEWKKARAKIFGWLEQAAKDKLINKKEVMAILGHQFKGRDKQEKLIRDYWGPESAALLFEVDKAENDTFRVEKTKLQSEIFDFNRDTAEQFRGQQVTKEMVESRIETFKKLYPGSSIPQGLNQMLTYVEQDLDDHWIDILESKMRNRIPILETDVMYIKDFDTWKKWSKEVGSGMGTENTEIRKQTINGMIRQERGEIELRPDMQSPEVYWNKFWASRSYNEYYAQARANDQSPAAAHTFAREKVAKEFKENWDGKWQKPPYEKVDEQRTRNLKASQTAIKSDPIKYINNKKFNFSEEEEYLEDGLKAINNNTPIAGYWNLIAKESQFTQTLPNGDKITLTGREILEQRLIATGKAKPGDFEIRPERKLTKGENQDKLLIKTSEGNTYQVFNDQEENTALLLDAVSHDPPNGYNTIYDKDGGLLELDKPLEQHTVGEVIQLMNQGYTNFGMYGIPANVLRETLMANAVSISQEDVFDQKTQDALVLARLRYRLAQKNSLTGLDNSYLRLVNVSPDLEKQFNTLLGGIHDNNPYMQIRNMLPEVAEAFVSDNTQ